MISLKALIRHQNQRRMNSSPVPAPTCSRMSKHLQGVAQAQGQPGPATTMVSSVQIRPASTSSFSEASGRTNRL